MVCPKPHKNLSPVLDEWKLSILPDKIVGERWRSMDAHVNFKTRSFLLQKLFSKLSDLVTEKNLTKPATSGTRVSRVIHLSHLSTCCHGDRSIARADAHLRLHRVCACWKSMPTGRAHCLNEWQTKWFQKRRCAQIIMFEDDPGKSGRICFLINKTLKNRKLVFKSVIY